MQRRNPQGPRGAPGLPPAALAPGKSDSPAPSLQHAHLGLPDSATPNANPKTPHADEAGGKHLKGAVRKRVAVGDCAEGWARLDYAKTEGREGGVRAGDTLGTKHAAGMEAFPVYLGRQFQVVRAEWPFPAEAVS